MFPYLTLFGVKISMVATGIILALLTFTLTVYQLCKKNNQDFYKFFYQLPFRLIVMYLLGRYSAFVLEHSALFPHSWNTVVSILRPNNFDLHSVGILVAVVISLWAFFVGIKRTENKKIWADILFSASCNALILLGLFLTLGDTFIGKATDSVFAIRALQPESWLTKFDGVYPVGIFLSLGVLAADALVTFLKIVLKKNWLGMWGFLGILMVLNICFLFQQYPRHGLVHLVGMTRDIKQYLSLLLLILGVFVTIRRNKKRF